MLILYQVERINSLNCHHVTRTATHRYNDMQGTAVLGNKRIDSCVPVCCIAPPVAVCVKIRPIGCPEISVRNYHYSLRRHSEQRSCQQNCSSCTVRTAYRARRVGEYFSFPRKGQETAVPQNIQTGSGAHPASYLNCMGALHRR
jgi:hypothetical protein